MKARGALLVGWLALVCGCHAAATPTELPKVEAIFDVPREYRVQSALPCAEGAGLAYVVSHDGELYSFDPSALAFRLVGTLDCRAAMGATPNSMAVDRSGTAWVNYSDGTMFRASTRDAHCKPTDYLPGQEGFGRVGMAFVSTGDDLAGETLFVWGGSEWGDDSWPRRGRPRDPDARDVRRGMGLAWIERRRLSLEPLGDDGGPLSTVRSDMTGTGDGRLFGFFATSPATLAEIDIESGAILSAQRLAGLGTGRAWAFSFWGGDFWLYSATTGRGSSVTRLGADGTLERVLPDVGFVIVGAGVSTCAPTGPT